MAIRNPVPLATFSLAYNFEAFLRNIRPSSERREAAKKYPGVVRAFLDRTRLLQTIEPHSRLTGSYGRHIAIHEIKDVDLVCVLALIYRQWSPVQALKDLKSALDGLADELSDQLGSRPDVDLREQRRSVRVHFVEPDFFLDVVPVLAPEGILGILEVPDREWQNWQPTACVAYGEEFARMNQNECNEHLVPLMKTVKHWRSQWLRRDQAKSFWLEAMVIGLIRRGKIVFTDRAFADIVAQTFFAIENECTPTLAIPTMTPTLPDPIIPERNPNVAWNWERGAFESFMRRIAETTAKLEKALEAESAAAAIVAWKSILGADWFPADITNIADGISKAAFAGTTLVGTTGRVYSTPPEPDVRTARPQPNRFHGDRSA